MKGVVIPAGIPYAEVISVLHDACFNETWNEKAISDILSMPGAMGFVIHWLEEEPQGYVLMRQAADEAEILSIAVIESARRSGLAGQLLQTSIDQARLGGAARLFLEVAEDNSAARAFYEKAGFTICGRRSDYYRRSGSNCDALIYALEITGK